MATDSDVPRPRVLLCPECQSEQQDQGALFRHLADAHPAVILGLPPKGKKKPKAPAAKKKLTWKEEAKLAMERADDRRGRKRTAEKPAGKAPAPKKTAAAPKAAQKPTPTAASPAPAPAPVKAATPATPAASPPAAPEGRCNGEHAWEASGQSRLLRFERCADCGARRMLPLEKPAPDALQPPAQSRIASLRRDRAWKD